MYVIYCLFLSLYVEQLNVAIIVINNNITFDINMNNEITTVNILNILQLY